MAAPKENKFWNKRTKHGRDKIFATPEILWEACCEYFEWCDDNPWEVSQLIKSGNSAGDIKQVPAGRPFTERGLFIFLDIDRNTWLLYKERVDFIPITKKVEEIIYTQKFEGASVGVFNQNIIARDLGLIDKKDLSTDGESLNKGYYEFLKQMRTKQPNND